MSIQLPEPIDIYYQISNQENYSLLEHCFATDAVVHDEGRTHYGITAIKTWLQEAKRQYQYSLKPERVSHKGDKVSVTSRATGNFPGSPVMLEAEFQLSNNKIKSLEIH